MQNFRYFVLPAIVVCCSFALADDKTPAAPGIGTLLAPKAFRASAAKVLPSLVTIDGFGGIAGKAGGKGVFAPGEGQTTGLIISEDGYIITSTFNFLRKPPIITVQLPGGQRKIAKLLGKDETRKICLLKVETDSKLPVPEFASREGVKVGQWVVALGVGFGDSEPALTAGIISAASRISTKAVQTDANLSPANYGGPLIDLDGKVLGLCVPLSPGGRGEAAGAEWYDSGIGFAVPFHPNDPIIAALKEGKTLQQPFMGVQTAPHGMPPTGAAIVNLVPGGPAEKAGLKKDDKILKVDGSEVIDVTHLTTVVGRYVAGDKVAVEVDRAGEKQTITVELGVAPPPPPPGQRPMPMNVPMPGKPGDTPPAEKPADGGKPQEKPAEGSPAPEKPAESEKPAM